MRSHARRAMAVATLSLPVFLAACAIPALGEGSHAGGPGGEAIRPVAVRNIEALLGSATEAAPPLNPPATLELEWLLGEILRRNPSLESMRRAWRAAEARAPQVSALDDPQAGFMFGPRLLDRIGQGSEPVGMGEPMEFGFAYRPEISQALPWPGKRRLRGEAADQRADAAFHETMEVRERLLNEAKSAYYELYLALRAREINRINLDILGETVEQAIARYEAGTASKQDVLQAEVDRERLHHRTIELERMDRVARARLNALLNRPPEADLPEPPASLPLPGAPQDRPMLQREAFQLRSELQALAAELEAQQTEVALARREFYPDFRISAAYDAFWQEPELRPMVGFGLNIPIQVGRRRAALREAEEKAAQARAELEGAVAAVMLEVETALQRLHEARHGTELYQTRVLPRAEENVEAALAGYESGELDLAAVLMAQRELMNLQLEAIELEVAARQRHAELERAVGRESGGGTPQSGGGEVAS